MIILGIDPGTTAVGYAFLEGGQTVRVLEAGLLSVRSHASSKRLCEIHDDLTRLIQKWNPDVAGVERLFFTKNIKTALGVSEARGVILLTTALAGLPTLEYTPLEVKKVVTGDGNADKNQMKKMIQLTLKDTRKFTFRDDVFDAIGIALTCFYTAHLATNKKLAR